ncbi:hypothetical protein [Azohydromonas sediminis]|uniref:hypothetical protein n=1 Tax=Azohydromonas sediminis TaxID=2259674 RepID=UPI000E649629|nr:hypothetical protein [Azohydromonas sediminis]
MPRVERNLTSEIAAAAARLVVDEGMEYGAAKRKAARALAARAVRSAELPSNDEVEDQVREYLALFHADTQPAELAALRRHALPWMQRLAAFRPHLAGAAWRGTATRLSSLHLDLFCDDPKAAEIALINLGIDYDVASAPGGARGEPVLVLSVASRCAELGETVTLHLHVRDLDDLRGALKPDARGRTLRGDLTALRRLLDGGADAPPPA